MKKHLFTLALFSVLVISTVSRAEFEGGFADIGVHYLDRTSRVIEKSSTKSHKDDFGYLELEGGANFSRGEMYGFFDWENFYNDRHDKPGSEQRYTPKGTNRIYLGGAGFNLYLHAYDTYGSMNRVNFHDDMFPYGINYNFVGSSQWFRSFFVKRYTDQIYYTDDSDYVADWVVGCSFMLGGEKFTLTSWNEYEFDRDVTYVVDNGGKKGLNGVVTPWWSVTLHVTVGIQYRYADDKPDEDFYQDAITHPVKFNFRLITTRASGSMNSLCI